MRGFCALEFRVAFCGYGLLVGGIGFQAAGVDVVPFVVVGLFDESHLSIFSMLGIMCVQGNSLHRREGIGRGSSRLGWRRRSSYLP